MDLGALELVHLLHQPALRPRHIHRAQHFHFSPFFTPQIFQFSPLSLLFLPWPPSPLTSLAASQLPCRGEARGRRGEGRQPVLRSDWSVLAASLLSLVGA